YVAIQPFKYLLCYIATYPGIKYGNAPARVVC
ncbi:MAG: hypothetical protein JWR67_2763, partial [Mucilaginibacter sp.]|nr:hypothetical protein [Mucilaginibacter sp.]